MTPPLFGDLEVAIMMGMDFHQNLIVRWDNAHHHKNISTYPFHKHIGIENTVEAANEISLYEVLSYIKQKI